jgi:hypothetical protein
VRRILLLLVGFVGFVFAPSALASPPPLLGCDDNGQLCTEPFQAYNYEGQYVGHDEPSVLFYSSVPGSGNAQSYQLQLPQDPSTLPNQSGTGGTWNFQLHPAFWFGMAMCDDQSAPNPGGSSLAGPQVTCAANSDTNIYTGTTPTASGGTNYIGQTPGSAFMEMQFYPPGWVSWPAGASCDASHWCAALNIDSLSTNMNTGALNNDACLNQAGEEYVNFAFITRNGVAQAPANPIDATLATYTPDPSQDLFMNSGDKLVVSLADTSAGFQVVIHDLTTGQFGSMTASVANGFGQLKWDPTATSCTVVSKPFHPMYSTSSENTRVVWAAHSYNVSFSDEIGHFEYCGDSACNAAGDGDADDAFCFPASQSLLVLIGGCQGTDFDFDGVPYQTVWPGSTPTASPSTQPTPILFSSPTFGRKQTYSRVGFETDLPRIEFATSPACNRSTGSGCVNPPVGANFYPMFLANTLGSNCTWAEGGPDTVMVPGAKVNNFGGSSTSEYGPLLQLTYPSTAGSIQRYNDFRNILNNPC